MIHADILGERRRLTPEKTALFVASSGPRLSYRELDDRARRAARGLAERCSLGRGERFGILAHNRLEYLDLFFAAGKSGAVAVPLGTRLTARELEHPVRDSGMRALFYDDALADSVHELRARLGEEGPSLWVALDGRLEPGDLLYADWQRELDAETHHRVACGGEDLCALLYTSGTTGRPKGVMIPHRMVAWNGYNTACCWQLREDDVSPIFTPLYHAGGLFAFLVPLFTIGGTVVLHRGFDAGEIWRTVEAEGVTVMLGVPTIFKMLMDDPGFARVDLTRVHWFISGGAPLPEYLIDAYQKRGVVFKQGFGMTEVGVNCFAMTTSDSMEKKGSIGKPMMMTEVRLVDGEGRDVARGEVGELLLRGPHVSLGYWNNPEATAAALDADGWFHSGDQALQDEEGHFYVAGRAKDMIISGGANVYPAEIEAQLMLHPAVEDAAVIGVPDEKWGEIGVAFVVPRAGVEVEEESLSLHLAERLAKYKIPRRFLLADELPRTAYGKVLKGELRDLYLDSGQNPRSGAVPLPLLTHQLDGAGETVLLLNGGMMTLAAWDPVAEPIAEHFQVLRCDFRGQLRSPGPGHRKLSGHVDDLLALLDHLGLERVHVLGASFGAEVGLLLAATTPERVGSITAVTATDVMTDDFRDRSARMRRILADILAGGGREPFYDAMATDIFSERYVETHRAELTLRRARTSRLPEMWFAGLDTLLGCAERIDLRPHLGRVEAPALVIIAGGDQVMPPERSRALAEAVDARVEELAESGHALIIENPEWLTERCLSFLRESSTPHSRRTS